MIARIATWSLKKKKTITADYSKTKHIGEEWQLFNFIFRIYWPLFKLAEFGYILYEYC